MFTLEQLSSNRATGGDAGVNKLHTLQNTLTNHQGETSAVRGALQGCASVSGIGKIFIMVRPE